MSVTISSIITNLNSYIGDSSTDRISDAERYQAITEATAWLLEELGNEHMVDTYNLDYLDTVYSYKVTATLPDLLTGADLRKEEGENYFSFTRKSPRELSEEIAQKNTEPSWAIERRDGDSFLVVNLVPANTAQVIETFEDVGNWVADTTNSDATNLTKDSYETKYGTASLNFDVDVSQSGNDRATIYNPSITNQNIENVEDIGSFILSVYLPDVSEISSISLVFGSDSAVTPATKANYWTITATTDIDGNAFVDGWNTIKLDWNSATQTGSPDSSAVGYYEIVINYTNSQVDDTDFRVSYLRVAKPERLTFHYISWNVGQVSGADITPITAFTAGTNVPFFSGRYDQYKYPVAHMAASLCFGMIRERELASDEEDKAIKSLDRYRKNFESQKTREVKSFKVYGVNLRRRNKLGKIR